MAKKTPPSKKKKTASKKKVGTAKKASKKAPKKSKKKPLSTISKALKKSKKKTTATRKKSTKTSSRKKSVKKLRVKSVKKLDFDKMSVSLVKKRKKTPTVIQFKPEHLGNLSFSYNETKLVLMLRDPQWAFSYWDFSVQTWSWIQDLKRDHRGLRSVLRIHNLDEKSYYDIDVELETKNWYLNLGSSETSFEADLGLVDTSGKFYSIVRSNRLRTPRTGPADEVDPAWAPENFDELYKLSGSESSGFSADLFSAFRKPKI